MLYTMEAICMVRLKKHCALWNSTTAVNKASSCLIALESMLSALLPSLAKALAANANVIMTTMQHCMM
jgi:hypothetical protein